MIDGKERPGGRQTRTRGSAWFIVSFNDRWKGEAGERQTRLRGSAWFIVSFNDRWKERPGERQTRLRGSAWFNNWFYSPCMLYFLNYVNVLWILNVQSASMTRGEMRLPRRRARPSWSLVAGCLLYAGSVLQMHWVVRRYVPSLLLQQLMAIYQG